MSVLIIGAEIPEHAPPLVKEGLSRRRLVVMTGACPPPCGATLVRSNRAERRAGITHAARHADDCPAIAPETVAWLEGRR